MNIQSYIWFTSFLLLVGCYTMLRHPTGNRNSNPESDIKEHKIVVTEDCNSCHNNFDVILHFDPVSTHQRRDWLHTPWWLDDNYLTIFRSSPQPGNPIFDSPAPAENSNIPKTVPPAYRRSFPDSVSNDTQEIRKSGRADSTENSKARDINQRKKDETNRRKIRKRN
jgi:hypothetical protein